jgi:hypothetical protein
MSVAPVSQGLLIVQETTILVPTKMDNENNVERKTNSIWSDDYIRVCREKLLLETSHT